MKGVSQFTVFIFLLIAITIGIEFSIIKSTSTVDGLSTGKALPITGEAIKIEEDYSKRFTSTYEATFTFKDFPEGEYRVRLQYRQKGTDKWDSMAVMWDLEALPREGNTIKLRFSPAGIIDKSGVYEFRLIGAPDSPSSDNHDRESTVFEIEFDFREECGSSCYGRNCEKYEACNTVFDEFFTGELMSSSCTLSSRCGATCNEWVEKYRNHPDIKFSIKDKPCSEFQNCVEVEKDDSGADIACEGNLCAGDCTEGPEILEASINPPEGTFGTVFTIQAKVQSVYSLSYVRAEITFREETPRHGSTTIMQVALYDDGEHGDVARGDGIFGEVWDTSYLLPINFDVKYEEDIEIKATDVNKKEVSTKIPFPVKLEFIDGLCKEVIEGHNDENSNRVNVVFVGIGYNDVDKFRKVMLDSIDFDGSKGGIFSQEPFKSNKEEFNFWYVTKLKEDKMSCGSIKSNDWQLCMDPVKKLASFCAVSNKYKIGLFNSDFRSSAPLETSLVSATDKDTPRVVTHEFGHAFGLLDDEYIEGNVIFEESSFVGKNVFLGTSDRCLERAGWKNFMGNGCGEDGTIDCISDYNPSSEEIKCTKKGKACHIEIGCFEGVRGYDKDGFRPTYNSIMRDHETAVKDNTPRAFGLVNERIICDRIEKGTGSAGGICNSIPKIVFSFR